MSSEFLVASGKEFECSAGAEGLRFRRASLSAASRSDAVARFEARLPVLGENGFVETIGSDLFLSYGQVGQLDDEDRALYDTLAPSAAFSVGLHDRGHLGSESFSIEVVFHLGAKEVHPARLGPFLSYEGSVYQMPFGAYELIRQVDAINALPSGEKKDLGVVLRYWGETREKAELAGASLSGYLDDERVVVADRVAPTFLESDSGKTTVVPEVSGASIDGFESEYLKHAEVPDRYSVRDAQGQRVRVVLEPEVKKVLEVWNRFRQLSRRERDELLCNPDWLIPEGLGPDVVDLSHYGPRVRAIGEYPSSVRPYVSTGQQWADIGDSDGTVDPGAIEESGIRIAFPDGESKQLSFESLDEAVELAGRVDHAVRDGEPTVEFRDVRIPATAELADALRVLVTTCEPEATETGRAEEFSEKRPKGKGLLIYTNEEALEFEAPLVSRELVETDDFAKPSGLLPHVELKCHQNSGVAWLKHSYTAGRTGVLLADDMGLGKTLQALTFLAWAIEDPLAATLGKVEGPWPPILVVAPPTLLSVWTKEIQSFFEPSLFMPHEILTTESARKMRVESGRESGVGRPVLDVTQLTHNRLVLTSYQTLAAYGLSLGQIDWSVVIADEAQALKDPNTRTSMVFKALKADFRIALTGTPVETRLLDVWNIFDSLEPGLLGSAKEFSARYEPRDESGRIVSSVPEARDLAAQIGVGGSGPIPKSARLLRRSKEDELDDLPGKRVHLVESELGEAQRASYVSLVRGLRGRSGAGAALAMLTQLNRVCQHPRLLGEDLLGADAAALVQECPKLASLVSRLDDVARRGEKALIFAHFRDAQTAIKRVVDARYDIDAPILNGDREGGTKQVHKARMTMIERFEAHPGFHAMVVSPRVGGVGLTITAANHVFHYGRWWNPAREDQCTDRVYRIGQKRDVHVYRLVAKDPQGRFRTFDERLDELLEARREAAESFLVPRGDEGRFGQNLADALGSEPEPDPSEGSGEISIRTAEEVAALGPDAFEALCAALVEDDGYSVYLTPMANDGGFDVVGVSEKEILLVQAKHTASRHVLSATVFNEMDNGELYYREKVLPGGLLGQRILRTCLMTNGPSSRQLRSEARGRDIEVVAEKELLKKLRRSSVCRSQIGRWEGSRIQSVGLLTDALGVRFQSVYV